MEEEHTTRLSASRRASIAFLPFSPMSKMESRVRSPMFFLAGGFVTGSIHEEEEGAVVCVGDCAASTGFSASGLNSTTLAMILET